MMKPSRRIPSATSRDRAADGKSESKDSKIGRPEQPKDRIIKFRSCYRNVVLDVLRARPNWKEVESDSDFDICWADKEWIRDYYDQLHLQEHQRLNHFRNHFELTRKDNLMKNLKRIKRQLEREDKLEEAAKYSFFPSTYLLPSEYAIFLEEWKKHPPGTFWIMKPIGKAQGKGIFLFNKLSQISNWKKDTRWNAEAPQAEAYIVQQYIANPYLVGGKKFDMRIYVLVSSYHPLKIWLHRNGFARFTGGRYSMDINDMGNALVHLTNVAIQRQAKNYTGAGIKWSIRNLKLFLISKHGAEAVNQLFADIQQVLIRTIIAAQRVMMTDRHCFELYGFDIIMDSNLKPFLLEVNGAPSMSADSEEDHSTKFSVLDDTLSVVDFEKKLKGNEEHIGHGLDLIYDAATGFRPTTCYLGCYARKPDIPDGCKTIGKKVLN
eukprot:TRINITY_DN7268_c0_g1_i1.p1 TRINITY_DN7268_c0_g1~~TRINITY_DN7268_c0_g1_i1.p1  ORF type:complete len:435 (-),score=136.52 TRINITY_DN7268_c0_g1_i1:62-1366(-)